MGWLLYLYHIRCLGAFFPIDHIEFNLLTLGQDLKSLSLNRREMDEDVSAAGLFDKTKPLFFVEPLHLPFSHYAEPSLRSVPKHKSGTAINNRASGLHKMARFLPPLNHFLSKGDVLIEDVPQRINRDMIDEDFVMNVGTR